MFLVRCADSRVHILVFSLIKPQLLIDFHLLHLYLHHLLNSMRPNNVRAPLRARGWDWPLCQTVLILWGHAERQQIVAEERGQAYVQNHKTHRQCRASHPKESWWAALVPVLRRLCLCLVRRPQLTCSRSSPIGQSNEKGKKKDKEMIINVQTKVIWWTWGRTQFICFGCYLPNQVVFCVSHVHSLSFNGHTLRGVKGSFWKFSIFSPAFRPWNRNNDPLKK